MAGKIHLILVSLFFAASLWGLASAANILVLAPFAVHSHYNFARNMIRELIIRGHNLTVISPFKEDDLLGKYRHVQVDIILPADMLKEHTNVTNMFLAMKPLPFMIHLFVEFAGMRYISEKIMESKPVKNFVDKDRSKYDLLLTEDFRFPPFFLMAHKYNVPIVSYTTFGGAHWVEHAMGNPMNLHYVTQEILPLAGTFTLWERLTNTVCSMWELLVKEFYFKRLNNAWSERFYSQLPQPLPKATEIEKNVSLVLLNTHFSMDAVRSYLPNIVEVAGIHISPVKELPKDLKNILDNAKDGVIFFSMGSLLRGADWPKEKLEILKKVLGELNQTVLWKWEEDTMEGKPQNVVIRKWFPQSDILAHPNVRAFITHGGLLGLQEAIFRGVPLIGIPIFADQPANIKKAKIRGYAEHIDYETMNIEDTRIVINRVVNDPKYRQKAKDMAALVQDRPMSAMETAMYWIEYVIRHKGAYHMKTPSTSMNWIEYYLLDVISIMAVTFISVLSLIYVLLRCCFITAFRSKKNNVPSEKKRK